MIKTLKKAISLFVTAVFILSLFPVGVFAGISYGTSTKASSMPWTGNDTPAAYMVNSDGALSVLKDAAVNSAAMPAIVSLPGSYGKLASDEIYQTYDLPSRTKRTYTDSVGCFRITPGSSNYHKDFVVELSFAYDDVGNSFPYSEYAEGIVLESYIQYYKTYGCANASRLLLTNGFAVRNDGIKFDTNDAGDLTGIDTKVTPYQFEQNKWYNITLVFDLENKTISSDGDKGSYTYKSYVNGKLATEKTITTPYYGVRYVDLYPAVDATVNWDNINFYTISDAASFVPQDSVAEIASVNENIVVSDGNIKLDSLATAADIKSAISASLKENETVRIYNSDYSEEIASDALALDAKLVVAGSRTLTNESTARENIYTYYDVKLDGYAFSEPTITIDDANLKATGSVKLYNYSGEQQEFKSYLAVYNGSELVSLNVSNTDIIAGEDETEVEYTTPQADLSNGNKLKFFIWNSDEITPEVKCVEKAYTIADEYDPKNADLESVILPKVAYNTNHNQVATLYPAFDEDVTEYTIFAYTKGYAGGELELTTTNSNATVALTTAPDTSLSATKAVYTVTSADGTVTKDYTFNYVASNDGTKRTLITNAANIYTKASGTCLASWNGKTFTSGSSLYLQDGIFVRSATDKRTIRSSASIIEVDISTVPEDIAYGVLRLAQTATFNAAKDGKVTLYKIDNSIYNLADLSTISTSNIATYLKDELCTLTVSKKTGNNADMYFVNIGSEYIKALKAAGRTKMYIGISGETTDPENGFSAQFSGITNDSTKYAESVFDYVVNI